MKHEALIKRLEVSCLGLDAVDPLRLLVNDVVAALKQTEQEPVAWGVFEGNLHDMFFTQEEAQEMAKLKGSHAEVRPLYTAPPQRPWVGLTEEDRAEILSRKWWDFEDEFDVDGFLRLAEAKLKEKNA